MKVLSDVYAGMSLSTETDCKYRKLLKPSSYEVQQDEYCRMAVKQVDVQVRKGRCRCNVISVCGEVN